MGAGTAAVAAVGTVAEVVGTVEVVEVDMVVVGTVAVEEEVGTTTAGIVERSDSGMTDQALGDDTDVDTKFLLENVTDSLCDPMHNNDAPRCTHL